jgi:hypothetical protein
MSSFTSYLLALFISIAKTYHRLKVVGVFKLRKRIRNTAERIEWRTPLFLCAYLSSLTPTWYPGCQRSSRSSVRDDFWNIGYPGHLEKRERKCLVFTLSKVPKTFFIANRLHQLEKFDADFCYATRCTKNCSAKQWPIISMPSLFWLGYLQTRLNTDVGLY